MALAGHDHVVVPVGTALGGAAGLGGDQRGGGGEQGRLGLLTAEAAAHAAHLDGHCALRDGEHPRNQQLHLAGMLGRGPDVDLAVFPGGSQRHLAFEIEMILAADGQAALQAAGRCVERGLGVAAGHALASLDLQVRDPRLGDGHGGWQGLVLDDRLGGGGAGRARAVGGDGEQALAHAIDDALGEQPVVMHHRAYIVLAGDVGGGEHGDDAGAGAHRRKVHAQDAGVGLGALGQMHVQQPRRFGQVVDIERRPGHMTLGAVVGDRGVDALEGLGQRKGAGGISHGRPLSGCGSPPARPPTRPAPCATGFWPPAPGRPPRRACR